MLIEGVQVVLLQALATSVMLLPGQPQRAGRGRSKLRHHGLHTNKLLRATVLLLLLL